MTIDDALWERVGRLLVARGKLGQRDLDSALAEYRRTRVALDDVLVARGYASRREVASAVLVVQLGEELQEHLHERRTKTRREPEPFPDVPCEPVRPFVLMCLLVDVLVFTLAVLVAGVARSSSNVPLPPGGWVALFGALALGVYWGWRLTTLRTKLRPWADAVLVAGATSLAAMAVLALRSLAGKHGVAEGLLPLWAFASVYGVAGRFAFYLAWAPKAAPTPEPVREPRRVLEVVPSRPDRSAS